MRNTTCVQHVLSVLACGTLLGGCATVDPRPEYQRAEREIVRTTGYVEVYQPGEDQRISARVTELLEAGITADEAAQIALLNNPELQAAFYEIGMAAADVVQAGLLSNPSLGVALRLPSGGGLANLEADLAQNIADLWQLPARKRAAERALDRTILQVARRAAATAAEAKSAYYTAAGADRRLEIATEDLEATKKILELTEFRRTAGAGSELDVNLARGVVLEAELTVMKARLARGEARRRLAQTLGLSAEPNAMALLEPLSDPVSRRLDTDSLMATALHHRLDLRAASQAVLAAKNHLALELRRVFPSFEVGLALERGERRRSESRDLLADTARASVAAGRLTAPEIEARPGKNTDLIIGPSIALELPVFDQNQAQIAKAWHEVEQTTKLLDSLKRSIRQDVRGAADRAQTAWDTARFFQEHVVPQAERNLEMSQESYRAGKSSILTVLDAERAYLSARRRYAESLEASARAIPELEQAIGLPIDRGFAPPGGAESDVREDNGNCPPGSDYEYTP